MADISRRIILPLAAIVQVAGSALPPILGWGIDVGERSRALDTAIVPAVWAFAIWGVIFLWSIAFAIYAATRSKESVLLSNKVTWLAIGAFTMNGVWAVYTPFMGLDVLSQSMIVFALLCGVSSAVIAGRFTPKSRADVAFISLPLGLVAGWLTAACFAGGSSVLLGLGYEITTNTLLLTLLAATVFATLIIFLRPATTYSIAIVWALSAVVSKNLDSGNESILYAASAAIIILTLITFRSVKRRAN